jgi:hypothetical protein
MLLVIHGSINAAQPPLRVDQIARAVVFTAGTGARISMAAKVKDTDS